jgi:hypothetical protein
MANATPARVGQINSAGDAKALFLKVFSGEVLTAFRERNVFLSRHMIRTIASGKSAQFPASWKATASYHTPGVEIVGQTMNHNERVISIDDLLLAPIFIPVIDEAMNHYDYRSEYSFQAGAALAKQFDINVAQVGLLSARASATVTGGNGGSIIVDADARTNADSLIQSMFDAAQALDEKDVPDEDRFVFVKPAQYYLMVNSSSKLIHADYTSGNGGVDSGRVFRVANLEIVKTNNLPSTNVTTGPAAYQGNFTNTAALVSHRTAMGTVKLIDLATEMEYDIRRQGTLVVAKYAIGHGILRPESAVEIAVA